MLHRDPSVWIVRSITRWIDFEMAKPGRMKEVEAEHGEPLDTLIPRLLNEKGSIPAVARVIGVADRTLFIYCKRNGIRKKVTWFNQSQQCKGA